MKLTVVLLAGLLVINTLSGKAFASDTDEFQKGNQAYQNAQYDEALKLYESLLKGTTELGSSELYFNTANTYYKLRHIGQAIFYYKKALAISPRDADIKYNLQYARSKTLDKIESSQSLLGKVLFLSDSFSTKEAYLFLIFSATLLLISSLTSLHFRNEVTYWTQRLFVGAFIISLFIAGGLWVKFSNYGVVTSENIKVFSAPGKDNVILFRLNEGTEFEVTEKLGSDWTQILLSDGKKGWVQNADVIVNL